MIAPLHPRVLLDQARLKVVEITKHTSWEDLRDSQVRLKSYVAEQSTLSADASSFLCEFSNVRRRGNESADTAARDDIRNAILQSRSTCDEHRLLEQLFRFVYGEDV